MTNQVQTMAITASDWGTIVEPSLAPPVDPTLDDQQQMDQLQLDQQMDENELQGLENAGAPTTVTQVVSNQLDSINSQINTLWNEKPESYWGQGKA